VVACEIMTVTPAVRSLIREQKTEQLSTVIQTNAKNGMVTMDKTLKKLYEAGIIDEDTVKFKAKDKGEFDKL